MLVYWKSHGKHMENQSGSIPPDFNQPTPEKTTAPRLVRCPGGIVEQ